MLHNLSFSATMCIYINTEYWPEHTFIYAYNMLMSKKIFQQYSMLFLRKIIRIRSRWYLFIFLLFFGDILKIPLSSNLFVNFRYYLSIFLFLVFLKFRVTQIWLLIVCWNNRGPKIWLTCVREENLIRARGLCVKLVWKIVNYCLSLFIQVILM